VSAIEVTPLRARLTALETQIAERESALADRKHALQQLQERYLKDVGVLYARLAEIDAAILDAEVRAGLRPPDDEDDESESGSATDGVDDSPSAGCAGRGLPTDGLKSMFRNLAKAIHPDLATDDAARSHRHQLMAEANRAYAERDEDRLRLILRAWQGHPAKGAVSEGPDGDHQRLQQRVADAEARLTAIDLEFEDLRTSAIGRLQQRIDDARRQGWDLFAEMVSEMRREIARASARLAGLGVRVPKSDSGSHTTGATPGVSGSPLQRRADFREVVIAVAHGVILQHELAGDRRVGVQRRRRRVVQLRVGEGPNRRSRVRTVAKKQIDGLLALHARVRYGMRAVHRVDVVHRDARDRLAVRQRLCELDFDRIHAGDMVDDDADRAAVARDDRGPLVGGQRAGQRRERPGAALQAIGQRLRTAADG
jgi:hypothetical protein